jgi:hypothetical protein
VARNRRDFLKGSVTALGVAAFPAAGEGAGSSKAVHETGGAKKPPFRLIFEAEWNDIPCSDYPLTRERWAEECIHPLLNTQVDTLLYNLCSSDAYCCELKSGELLMDRFSQVGSAWVWRYRENTKRLIASGANPPKLAVEYGHRLGLKVVPIVRMNDPHDMFYKYEVSRFKKNNPHLLLGYGKYPIDWEGSNRDYPDRTGIDFRTWGMFDFAHAEVRERKLAIIEEFITRWENDGVALDFERDPRYFKEFGKAENAVLMTGLIRRVREILDRIGKRRHRKLYLHVRVSPKIEIAYERGLDLKTWVQEGLVDAISPGAGYMTVTLDLKPWLDLVRGKACWIYPSINHWRTTEETRAWAKLMYHRGAHGLQLFNYGHLLHGYDERTPPQSERMGTVWFSELHPNYYRVLHEIAEVKTFEFKNKRYVLESASHEGLDMGGGKLHRLYRGVNDIVLPIQLDVGTHRVPFGFADDLEVARGNGASPRVTLRLMIVNSTEPDEFDVQVNGNLLPTQTRQARAQFIMNDETWVSYPLPAKILHLGDNIVEVYVRKLNSQMSVKPVLKNMEVLVEYDQGLGKPTT